MKPSGAPFYYLYGASEVDPEEIIETSHPQILWIFNMVIKPEDRQLIANYVKNLTMDQWRKILFRLLKIRSKSILTEHEDEKFREPLEQDAEPRQQETRVFQTETLRPAD